MAIKKRFTIAKELASGIRNTVQSAASNAAHLHYDLMSLDIIECDPLNPRKLMITLNDIEQGGVSSQDLHYQMKQKEYEGLSVLAESIKKIGIRNAIEVYKNGKKYRIISGERRYLASILAGQTHVPVRISQQPDELKLRFIQWVENINREDLSLYEKYNNLITIKNAYEKTHHIEMEVSELQKILGASVPQAYRYYSLLNASPALIDLVKSRKVTNLKIVDELAHIKDKQLQEKLIQKIQESDQEVTSLSKFKNHFNISSSANKRKSKAESISLGKVKNKNIAKILFQVILQDKRLTKHQELFNSVDWRSSKMVNSAFKKLINLLEKEFVEV